MFDKLGKFTSRFRYPIILVWVATVILVTLLAPDLGDVSISDQSSFLPSDSPSIQASLKASEYFPEQASSGSIVLVLYRSDGKIFDTPGIETYLGDITRWLTDEVDPSRQFLTSIYSPADPAIRESLTSEDGQVVFFNVGMTGSMDGSGTNELLKTINEEMKTPPVGIQTYVTGGYAIPHNYKASALSSADKTTLITVVLVITILLIIYRSPVLPIIPLMTIGIAYGISRGVVAWLTQVGMVVSSFTDVFLVVLLFGAGTDYCLFIISRFREYMADDYQPQAAAHSTIARVGETITSSAGTVIVGMIAMYFVELKIFASSGPALALGIFIALLAGLTLTPALLAALGRKAFWPGIPRHASTRAIWGRLAELVAHRPWLPLVLALIFLIPLAIYGLGHHSNFDMLADLPASDPAKLGFTVLSEHFGAGEMQPMEVIMTELPDGRSPQGIAAIQTLTQQLRSIQGVADVRSLTQPLGQDSSEISNLFRVESQLSLMADGITILLNPASDGGSLGGGSLPGLSSGMSVSSLASVGRYLSDLAVAFPDLLSDPDYRTLVSSLGKIQDNDEVILYQLPLSSQLTMISGSLSQDTLQSVGSSQSVTEQFAFLGNYLGGLGQAIPAVMQMDGYADALAAAGELERKMAELSQIMLLQNQLSLVASRFEETSAQLEVNPLALAPQEGQPSINEQMAGLQTYLAELGAAFPELKASADFVKINTTLREFNTASSGSLDLAKTKQTIQSLASAFRGLANTAGSSLPEATFIPRASIPGTDATSLVGDVLEKLSSNLERLRYSVQAEMPEAHYVPASIDPLELKLSAASLLTDASTLQGALRNLAAAFSQRSDGFFLPTGLLTGTAGDGLSQLVDRYVSAEGEATRLQVVLSDEPYSETALNTVPRLREVVAKIDHGYVSGGSAVLYDLRDTIARDMRLLMVLVLSGISLVMILLLRSLVAPFYLILTILLSYASTLGITRLLFEGVLNTNLSWFVPFFIFTLLMSLGMDYNIFLMGRVKEETAEADTRLGVRRAMERTGGIITSAGIIMAGTFAAMLSSSLMGLVQLAFAITAGVLLDTFVIRTTLVPAIAILLGRWNWWPRKKA